jgi:hypothetical protein
MEKEIVEERSSERDPGSAILRQAGQATGADICRTGQADGARPAPTTELGAGTTLEHRNS